MGILEKFKKSDGPIEPPHDFVMPREWTPKQKWLNVILISFQAAFTPITSTMIAAGTPNIALDFNLTDTFSPRLPVALYVLALGIGPLFLGPLSEIYGRRRIYCVNFTCFAICNLICGFAPNIGTLTAFRFFAGLAGSASTTLSGATVGDMFVPAERARAQAIYGAAPLLGPVIGGILGGYIIQGLGTWRWTMWIMTICPGLSVITCIFFLRETYAPFLMRKYGLIDPHTGLPAVQPKLRLSNTLLRPIRFLVMSPTCTIMAIYVGFGYGIFYFHIVTVPLVFGPTPVDGLFSYQWAAGNTGLAYLGLGIGSFLGVILAATMMNRCYQFVMSKMGGSKETYTEILEHRVNRLETLLLARPWEQYDCEYCSCDCGAHDDCCEKDHKDHDDEEEEDCPEARLPFMGIALILTPVGLTIFAWTTGPSFHWIFPLIGAGIFGGGIMMAYVSIQNYLVDSFGDYAASALAATALLRAPLACGLSVVSFEAYEKLNYSWGTMLLAFVLVAMIPGPLVLFFYGKKLRGMGRMS